MKRQAEHQLTKIEGPEGDEEMDDENPRIGLQKASEEVLARRPMKGLPQRGAMRTPQAGAPSATPTAVPSPSPFAPSPPNPANTFGTGPSLTPSSTSSFSGFGGFGTSGTSTSISPTNSTPSFSASGSTFTFGAPANPASASPTATSTSKAFASLLNNGSPFGVPPSGAPPAPAAPSIPSPGKNQDDSTLQKYYTSIRGLNISVLGAISKKVEEDPFADMSEILEKYQSFRSQIQKDFEGPPTSNGNKSAVPVTPSPAPSTTKPSMPAMPAPPPVFAGFGGFKSPSSSESSTTAKPSSAPTNIFDLKPSSSSPFGQPSAANPFAPKDSKPPTSAFGTSSTFGSSATNTATNSTPNPSTFSFGSSAAKPNPVPPSSFIFGSSTTPIGTPPAASNTFGAPASNNVFSFKPTEKPADKPLGATSSNPFGVTDKTSSTPSVFAPVSDAAKSSSSSASHFGFSGSFTSTSATPGTSAEENTTEGESSGRGTPAVDGDDMPPMLGGRVEGQGEEDEDTAYEAKVKAYRWPKPDEKEAGKWLLMGTGMLKLKQEKAAKEGEKPNEFCRRMLLRHDVNVNAKVLINFKLYPALKITQGANGKTLSFVGHDNGVAQTYNISFPNPEEANKYREALEEQISAVQAKSDS